MQKNQTTFRRTMCGVLLTGLLLLSGTSFSQKTDTVKKTRHFSGSIQLTHNGISVVPTFSLGKPAALFILSIGGERLSFEPDIRFALEGKPWSFLFWWRYKLVQAGKFRLSIGAHPAFNFRSFRLPVNGDSTNVLVARPFLAGELSPNYRLSKNVSIGIYYLFSRGFDKNVPKHNHFLTLNSVISAVNLPGKLELRLHPQFYYLRQDRREGFYFTGTFSLTRKNFPLSVSAIINREIESDIAGSKFFIWNTSLVYSFNRQYVRQ